MLTSIAVGSVFVAGIAVVGVAAGNHALRTAIDHVLEGKEEENFTNKDNDGELVKVDECKKIDEQSQKTLNFQTGTNIPLSQTSYKNYVGNTYIYKKKDNSKNKKTGVFYLPKNKLLYDGIWEEKNNNEVPYIYQSWKLVDKPVPFDYYTSNKLFEINEKMPYHLLDDSALYKNNENPKYYTYINDNVNDVCDKEIACFEDVFNKGMYPNR
jgi:hypothetical protein